ncbi:GNAT family N-acetyltransferase [Nocardioides sp. cx-173]|uniref:bifunctional acetate--CoA ligase family protein/GNAT family N-acetyltransferase n=1 Tax=Nocardioides sp. cx-173 TaxID=2898796 RepID=UPI001E3F08DA|nr:GNAT family N-acetyltransferase [Nocardioides sp. cx-173]MCD4524980.1 GNAT family N-acetyltransferase [Nocardioides sp. cx-173]UGB40312.1 GNAT family N-acetyltransferase [Nocardioides sp. cx-173]
MSVDAVGDGPAPADVLLRDGSVAVIRRAAAEDRDALRALHDGVSDTSFRFRFFSTGRKAGQLYVAHVLEDPACFALVAERKGRLAALATAEQIEPEVAEVAFLVAEEFHGLGLGSLLLEHLAAACRDRGTRRFVAEVLGDNTAMLRVFVDAGFTARREFESGVAHVEMDTTASAAAVEAADERETEAEARSLHPLLYPRSVAVVGARRDGTGVGSAIIRSIVAGGFSGPVHAVHPQAHEIEGVPAHPRVVDVPGGVDLLVVAVPAAGVVAALEDAAAAGVPSAVVVSSGFEGPDGARAEGQMLAMARRSSIRIVGPDCLGILVNHADLRLHATFSGVVPPPGGLAVASQSGGVGIVLTDVARRLGLGVGTFVSLGDKADVSGNDLLAAWRDDPRVSAAALYLESFGNPLKFARFARRFSEAKPLLAVVGGRSGGERRTGGSHTAAAATPAVAVSALFAQAGVVNCTGAEDMAEAALVLTQQPLPSGSRVAVLSNGGGLGALAAEAAEGCGLVVAQAGARLRRRLARHVQGAADAANPVDAGAAATAAALGALAEELLRAEDEVDVVLVVLVATGVGDADAALRAVAQARAGHPDRPLVLVPMGGLEVPAGLPGVTVLPSIRAAAEALGRAVRYAEWRRAPRDQAPPVDAARAERARRTAQEILTARGEGGHWLDAEELGVLLSDYGLAPTGRVAHGMRSAERAAREVGYPVVLKVADRDVVHKTARGLVRVGITTAQELRAAVRDFERELGHRSSTLLVQALSKGVEVALGAVRDPAFGPLVMVAAGGVATEVWADRVFLLPPVSAGDAARAVSMLRVSSLLQGDVDGLVDLLVRLGRLAEDLPYLAEMDLNPVMVGEEGCALVDVKVRLEPAARVDSGIPRQLRGRPAGP